MYTFIAQRSQTIHYPKGGISGTIMPGGGGGGGLHSSGTTEWRWKMHAPTSWSLIRGTQREYSSKPLKHSIVGRTLVSKR